MTLTPEKKKQILAGLLLVILMGALYFNFSRGDDAPTTAPNRAAATRASQGRSGASPAGARAAEQTAPLVTTALDLASMSDKAREAGATGRNIFVYPPPPTPTPTPTPIPTPTPPPPPITLAGLSPSGVMARTGDFTLTLLGAKMPADAKAFLNGRDYKTTFVNESQIKVAVPASAIASPGALRIEVRSAQDRSLYSNPLNLNVTMPPPPPFRYLGLIIKNGVHMAVLKSDTDEEALNVVKGAVIGGHWRIVNITEMEIELIDTNINVPHRIRFTGESG
jgi:hypothetical protein